jgi:phage-related protein
MNWTITYYSASVQEEILALPARLLARYLRYSDRMEVYGPDLGMPHTRAMGGGLFELRLKAAEGIARVLYCTMIGREIMILHQFIKKSDKTPTKELRIARRRMKEVKDAKPQRS